MRVNVLVDFKMSVKTSFILIFTLVVPSFQHMTDDCHPHPREDKDHYIIGYGSLINTESKNKTYPETGVNIPVRVTGFKRTWTARGYSNVSLSTTYLGVEISPENTINGVIFHVPNAEAVSKYDLRERLYCRVNVPWKDIMIFRGNISDNGTFPSEHDLADSEFWIYVTMESFRKYPDESYPIVQSYVDIFLSGCIQMQRKYGLANYSDECVTTTYGWESPWVNDRLHPRRPFSFQGYSGAIDSLIGKHVNNHLEKIYVERFYYGRSGGSHTTSSFLALLTTTSTLMCYLERS